VSRTEVVAGLGGGVLSLAAYGLVLWAQTRGALAPIAALRETSVVIGAIIGAVVFHERFGRWRIVATVLVAGGVVLINL
jgi:drug/metabolite transporter (DMT)-like permease